MTESDFEDLSAYLDGRLTPERAARVERLIASDSAWQEAWRRLQAVDEALGSVTIPPAPADLPDRIIASVRGAGHRRRWTWLVRIGVPLAAAAAVLIVALILADNRDVEPAGAPPSGIARHAESPAPADDGRQSAGQDDALIVEYLDFFRDIDVLENYETLEAIERLEQVPQGT